MSTASGGGVLRVDGERERTVERALGGLRHVGPGAFLATPNGLAGAGENIEVAERDLGGHHVAHAALSYETGRGRYHARTEIAGGAIAWGAPQQINQGGNVSPDGPSVVIIGRTLHAIRHVPSGFDQVTYDLDAGGPWTATASP